MKFRANLMGMENGTVAILNVGEGDLTISFDPANPADTERAKAIVTDMLKRGYALLVQVGEQEGEPIFKRAKAFDHKTSEYIVSGDAPKLAEKPEKAKRSHMRIPAQSTKAVAVGRSAGGYDPRLPSRIVRNGDANDVNATL